MPPFLRRAAPYLAIFALGLLAGLPSLRSGFVFDDEGQVLRNPAVREFDLGAIFSRGYWANASEVAERIDPGAELYRPLTTLSIARSYQLYGSSPLGYRIENLGLHALASVLLFYLFSTWGLRPLAALFGAALFAVAPIHAEVLGSIILRNELLAACCGAIALAAHARGRSLFAAAAMLGALLAKESAIALPALAWLADRAGLRTDDRNRGAARRYGPLLAVCALALVLRLVVIGQLALGDPKNLYFHDESTLVVWLTMARYAAIHYLGAAIAGAPLVFDFSPRSFAHADASEPLVWILLAGWIALAAIALVAFFRSRSRAAFGLLFFLVALGPTANLLARIGILGANRLAYFPYAGLAFALAALAEALLARAPRARQGILAVLALLVAGYGARTWHALAAYAHPYTLYSSVLSEAPENALALGSRGLVSFGIALGVEEPPAAERALPEREWLARSLDDLLESLRIDPSRWRAAFPNLVHAAFHLDRALELAPLFDACLRRKEPGLSQRLPRLDGSAPNLAAWAVALEPFGARGVTERALAAVARLLPGLAEIESYDPAFRDSNARNVQLQRIAELARTTQALQENPFVGDLIRKAVAPGLDLSLQRWRAELR